MRILLLAAVLFVAGCSGPFLYLPGGALEGPERPWRDAVLPPEGGVIQLETNPADPYSVNINAVTIDGQLYIDPASDRQWYQHMVDDPRVRVRFDGGETVYTAQVLTDVAEDVRARFEADRIVLRLAPRDG